MSPYMEPPLRITLGGYGLTIPDHAAIGEGAIAAGSLGAGQHRHRAQYLGRGACQIYQESRPGAGHELNQKIAHNYLMWSDWYKEE